MSPKKPPQGKNPGMPLSPPSPSRESGDSRLDRYRTKRSPGTTPEPFGEGRKNRSRIFVIQKHAATRLHYDLRLEWNGVLLSWAVPNGPSLNPADKRLAMHVEDHPVDYAHFEGVIPKGNYGAGSMIVWDQGTWRPINDPDEGLATGKVHFALTGCKLRGEFELVKIKGKGKSAGNEWLLFKKKDDYARPDGYEFDERSILSGLTVEDLGAGRSIEAEVLERLSELDVPPLTEAKRPLPFMLAETADDPFSSPEWLFELKYDGYRMLATRTEDGTPVLTYRAGGDMTALYPELAGVVRALPYRDFMIDGEVVVLDEKGRPDFQRLQKRARLTRRQDIEIAVGELPATLFAFDLLSFAGRDLRGLPLSERKELLRKIVPSAGPIRYADHIVGAGAAMFEQVRAMGLEGVLAKKIESKYRSGRSPNWLKVSADRTGDFVVVGFTPPKGSRAGLGALDVGLYDGEDLVYAGRVGTGFTDDDLTGIRRQLETIEIEDAPGVRGFPKTEKHHWVKPERVVEVRYKTFTEEGLLRHPVFVRFRPDKGPRECVVEPHAESAGDEDVPDPASAAGPADATGSPAVVGSAPPPPPSVPEEPKVSNPRKIFWPEDRYTKSDLINYYRAVSPWLLPYLADRPLVLTRYPDGIHGKSFYQKQAPDYMPDWIRTVSIFTEEGEKYIDYIVCESVEALTYVANLGTIPLHIWSSRADRLQRPDWCILDLDPKDAPFSDVVTLALAIHELCTDIDLPAFVKTSGSSGLHVLIPLGGRFTYEQSRMLAQLIARIIEARNETIATTTRVIADRGGKVYLDFLQNRHGQLLVAPYSVRPLAGAPVSAPLLWKEVNEELSIMDHTIRTMPERLKSMPHDPVRDVLDAKPDLVKALIKLEGMLKG